MNILHLTDLHFSKDIPQEQQKKKWDEVLVKIIKGCSEKKIKILAVTGDFTCHGAEEEFVMAEEFLKKVMRKLNLKEEQVLICPGNHDADTDDAKSTYEHYEAFEKRFYGDVTPVMHFKSKKKKEDREQKIAFVTINTCHETSLEIYEKASLTEEDYLKTNKIADDEYGIVLMHHQPEAIINHELFIKMIKDGKVKLILSGHQHMSLPRVYYAEKTVIVNGMAITPHREWMKAGCQIVKVKNNEPLKIKQIDL